MKSFKELIVWEKSHRLAVQVYLDTKRFPKEELYGLTGEMRRCSASIPAKIAEGCGRNRESEWTRFLEMALGSASELEYLFLLSRDLGYLGQEEFNERGGTIIEIKRMLAALIQKFKTSRE